MISAVGRKARRAKAAAAIQDHHRLETGKKNILITLLRGPCSFFLWMGNNRFWETSGLHADVSTLGYTEDNLSCSLTPDRQAQENSPVMCCRDEYQTFVWSCKNKACWGVILALRLWTYFSVLEKSLSIEENQDEGSRSYSSPYCQDGLLSGDSIVFKSADMLNHSLATFQGIFCLTLHFFFKKKKTVALLFTLVA